MRNHYIQMVDLSIGVYDSMKSFIEMVEWWNIACIQFFCTYLQTCLILVYIQLEQMLSCCCCYWARSMLLPPQRMQQRVLGTIQRLLTNRVDLFLQHLHANESAIAHTLSFLFYLSIYLSIKRYKAWKHWPSSMICMAIRKLRKIAKKSGTLKNLSGISFHLISIKTVR